MCARHRTGTGVGAAVGRLGILLARLRVLRQVRGDDSTAAIPIIMITSRSADKHRNYALDLGVNAFFGKPFPEPELLATMQELLNPQEA